MNTMNLHEMFYFAFINIHEQFVINSPMVIRLFHAINNIYLQSPLPLFMVQIWTIYCNKWPRNDWFKLKAYLMVKDMWPSDMTYARHDTGRNSGTIGGCSWNSGFWTWNHTVYSYDWTHTLSCITFITNANPNLNTILYTC